MIITRSEAELSEVGVKKREDRGSEEEQGWRKGGQIVKDNGGRRRTRNGFNSGLPLC